MSLNLEDPIRWLELKYAINCYISKYSIAGPAEREKLC